MLTQTQEQILEFLLRNPEEKITIRGIAKRLNKSYTLVYNNIKNLEKKKIIRKTSIPPAQMINLHESAPKSIIAKIELNMRDELLNRYPWIELMLMDVLEKAENPFFILIIFGSYAKSLETNKSDIDLLAIVKNKEEKKEMEILINNAYTKAKKSLIIVDIKEFKEMTANSKALTVGNEAKKNHIILHGLEQYYQMIR